MYKAKELADYLSFDSVPSSWEHCLEDAWNLYSPDWIEKMDFKEIMEFYDLEEPLQARILTELHLLNSDERLNFLCWLWHYILFYASSEDCGDRHLDLGQPFKSFFQPRISHDCGHRPPQWFPPSQK